MRTTKGSIFYKVLLVFIILGTLPAMLVGARLLTLNRSLLQAGGEGWSLPPIAVQNINQALTTETGAYLIYTFLVTGLAAIFIAGGLISPIRQLQQIVEHFRHGEIPQGMDIHTGDEIEELAESFTRIARELIQLQRSLETRVTERAHDLERRVLQLQIAAQVAREAASSRDLNSLLEVAANLVRDRFKFYYVGIFMLDDKKEYAILRSATGEAGRIQLERGYKIRVGDVGVVGNVSSLGDLRVVNDIQADFTYQRDALLPNTHSEMALPLKVGRDIIGALDVQSNQMDAFGDEDIATLQILADQLAVAIQNARLVTELESRLKEINALYQRYTRESWSRAILGEKVAGYQYDLSEVSPIDSSLLPQDVYNQLKPGAVKEISLPQASATLVAPLAMYDQLIGVIGVEKDDPKRQWSAEEIALLEAVSNQVALALDNARLLEETQLRTDQLRMLQEITAAAASHVQMDQLLGDVAHKIQAGFALMHCGIVLFDANGKTGTIVADASEDPTSQGAAMTGTKVPIDTDLTQQVVRTRKSIVIYDVQNNPASASFHKLVRQLGSNGLALVPLISRSEVIGTIGMDIKDPNRRLSEDDLRLMDQISLQISSAIDVARNFEQTALQAEHERMVAEVTSHIRETLNVEAVMQTAVNEIYRNLELDEISLFLTSEESEQEKVS